MAKRQLTGTIVSDKMTKTVVVLVGRLKVNRKYKQRYKTQKSYKAHVTTPDFHAGDKVVIEECSPISKDKKWIVVKKISSGSAREEKLEVAEDPKI